MTQALISLLDLKKEVWLRCRGQAFADTKWGADRIVDAINRAYQLAVQTAGCAELAGDLFISTKTYSITAPAVMQDITSASENVLLPIAVEHTITSGSVQCYCQKVSMEELVSKNTASSPYTGLLFYAFTASAIHFRPSSTGTMTLHYIKQPTPLSGDSDKMVASPTLVRAIAAIASADLLCQLESATLDEITVARKEAEIEVQRLEALRDRSLMNAYAARTGANRLSNEVPPGAMR